MGPSEDYLGDPQGGISGIVSVEREAGLWRLLGNLGLRLQGATMLPGVEWANRWLYGFGVRMEPGASLFVTAEVQGSTPMRLLSTESAWPAEILATFGGRAWDPSP